MCEETYSLDIYRNDWIKGQYGGAYWGINGNGGRKTEPAMADN